MTIGKNIKELRKENGMTQLEFSKKIKVNNSVLSRIENNDRPARDDELIKIADFFDVSVDYLLGRTNIRKHSDKFAAHTDEDWSDEAKAELENFKDYLRMKYKK